MDRMIQIFNDSSTDTQDIVQLKIHMLQLEKLLTKETKVWWNLSTLENYLQKDMIPRGLRMRKNPPAIYGKGFVSRWINILSLCSIKLMELLINYERGCMQDTREEIKSLQASITPYAALKIFAAIDAKIKNNITKLKTQISEFKKSKFTRDLQD